jgi:hypothetical protein
MANSPSQQSQPVQSSIPADQGQRSAGLLDVLRSEVEFWKNAFNVLLLAMFIGLIYVFTQPTPAPTLAPR